MGTSSHEQVALLTDYNTNSAYNKAYQTLYANIRFSQPTEPAASSQHTILFTTPVASSGYAAAAANVAIAAAQNGMPTILVDAVLSDPRGSSLGQRFGVTEKTGLSDLLQSGNAITLQAIKSCLRQTFISDLHLICAGSSPLSPQDASRLLSTQLTHVLADLRHCLAENEPRTGLIIFSGPPLLAGIEAAQIASLVDQTYLILTTGRSTRQQAKRAQEQLERANAKLTGVILLDA